MDIQLAIVTVLVTVAVLYIGWRAWRTWAGAKGGKCGGGCGCASATAKKDTNGTEVLISSEQITLRRNEHHS